MLSMTYSNNAQSPAHSPRRLARDHGNGCACRHWLSQEQLSFSSLVCDSGLPVFVVSKWFSFHSLAHVSHPSAGFWLRMGNAL